MIEANRSRVILWRILPRMEMVPTEIEGFSRAYIISAFSQKSMPNSAMFFAGEVSFQDRAVSVRLRRNNPL